MTLGITGHDLELSFDWAEWIKSERLLRGWSQNGMAKRAVVSGWQNTLSRIESEKIGVTLRTLVIVAHIFEYSARDVMDIALYQYKEPLNHKTANDSEIGKIIKARRESLGFDKEELSKYLGFNSTWLDYVEEAFPKVIEANTVILLDKVLDFEGELVGVAWKLIEEKLLEKI